MILWSGCRRGVAVLGLALLAGGCVTSVPLERGVLAYDSATAETQSKELLVNIARARRNLPIHFTAVSNIAATYKVSLSGGITPALTGDKGFLAVPFFSAASEENPTLSISPLQGDEFTQRLLTPIAEQKVLMLLDQGYDVDALLRLIAGEIRLPSGDGASTAAIFPNRPSNRAGYEMFRRVVAHLSWIQDNHALRVEPLVLHYEWSVPASAMTPDAFQSLQGTSSISYDATSQGYTVAKRVVGRLIIANYDPRELPREELARLNEEAEAGPANAITVDIRPGHTGGQFPIHGQLRLRSFHETLSFLGRGMEEEPEYDVAPDPRTPSISDNPAHTLDVVELAKLPPNAGLSVVLDGRYYALRPQTGYQWNRKVFNMLYQLFQMTVSAPVSGGPAITIGK